jgi:hypothetical protein
VYTGAFPLAVKTLVCDQIISGRYLFIQINSDGFTKELLTLCEVEVYGKCSPRIQGKRLK